MRGTDEKSPGCRFAHPGYGCRVVLIIGVIYNFGWLSFALGTMWLDRRKHGAKGDAVAIG
jgi:hypothetical protein